MKDKAAGIEVEVEWRRVEWGVGVRWGGVGSFGVVS